MGPSAYIPPTPDSVTLQPIEFPASVEDHAPAADGQVPERDLSPHPLAGRPSATQRAAVPDPARTPSYGQILVFAGLLEVEKARKNCGVAFGDHAAGVVASDVAGHAVRQQAFSPVSEAHSPLSPPESLTP